MALKGCTINGTKNSSKGSTVNRTKNSSKGSTVNGTKNRLKLLTCNLLTCVINIIKITQQIIIIIKMA